MLRGLQTKGEQIKQEIQAMPNYTYMHATCTFIVYVRLCGLQKTTLVNFGSVPRSDREGWCSRASVYTYIRMLLEALLVYQTG